MCIDLVVEVMVVVMMVVVVVGGGYFGSGMWSAGLINNREAKQIPDHQMAPLHL